MLLRQANCSLESDDESCDKSVAADMISKMKIFVFTELSPVRPKASTDECRTVRGDIWKKTDG